MNIDKITRRKRGFYFLSFVFILFIIFYFRQGILKSLSSGVNFVFYPAFSIKEKVENYFDTISSAFYIKKNLVLENKRLNIQLQDVLSKTANYNSVLQENTQLKEILGRLNENEKMILGSILSRPNQNFYDTIIIDIGIIDGISQGQLVFAFGNIAIGKIAEVYENSSKVILFSTPGEKNDVVVAGKDIFFELLGRGIGNFEMLVPRDLVLEKGTGVVLPGIKSYLVANVITTISDQRDSFQRVLLTSPININQLKFVQVLKQ